MTTELRLPGSIAEIDAGPAGPEVGAFFDLDGTLIAGYSARYLAQDRMRRRELGASELVRSLALMVSSGVNEKSFGELLELGAAAWAGRAQEDLEEMGLRIFQRNLVERIYPEMRDIVEAHQRRGHTVVLSSSASIFQAQPVAGYLGIEHVLCNRFVTEDGVLTGEVQRPILFGPGKANAAQAFATERKIDLGRSFFYADGDEDAALMYLVGNPRPTNPGSRLVQIAAKRGWPVLRFTSRGGGIKSAVRTLAGVGVGLPLSGIGLGIGLARRDKWAGINFVYEHWLQAVLDAGGVRVNVIGEENAWKYRPAVFLVNHRNSFDGLIAMRIVRKDFTAVAKAEIGKNPVAGAVGKLLDVAWVDRENTDAAVAALQSSEDLARKGLSVLIAPEGTRLDTKQVGPFKKGAFRIAMGTGLPIVPIIIRNADSLAGRKGIALHPGVIDVAVLEPISVDGWKVDELPKRIEEVRQLYVDTLAHWPRRPSNPFTGTRRHCRG